MTAPSPGVPAPSGEQHVIEHGGARAVVTEVGATLRSYTVDGRQVVDGFEEGDICRDGRGQVLCPWPNRLGDGAYEFGGRRAQAALDEPARRNAIHGLVRYQAWSLRGRAQNAVTLACTLSPQPGYPWRLEMEVAYRLGRAGLTVRAEATNLDREPVPLGVGFHPYVTAGTPDLDTARLHLRAETRLRADDQGLPVGEEPVAGSDVDFSVPRPIGPTRLDTAFGGLRRDADGLARVELRHPDDEGGVTVWMDEAFRWVMLYSADRVSAGDRRRRSLAVEPMTCPPDALRSGTDLVVLGPGGSWRGTWGISPR